MKKFYLPVLCFLLYITADAMPTNNAVPAIGNWNTTTTWSLGRLPQHGDTVVIPVGKTVIIDDIQNYSTSDLFLKIYGTLEIINGKLWLGANSTIIIFTGGVINASGSPSETLKIGGDVKFQGTQGSITGPAIANGSTGTAPTGFAPFPEAPLPVKFIAFNVARQNNDVLVQWVTAEEFNNDYYEVQRSENGTQWTTITQVDGAGNSSATQSYSYNDRNATAKELYYRIRQVDLDGKSTLTVVRMVRFDAAMTDVKISSGGTGSVYVHFSKKVTGKVVVRILNTAGQQVSQSSYTNPVGQVLVPVTTAVKGIYVVSVTDGQGLQSASQVLF